MIGLATRLPVTAIDAVPRVLAVAAEASSTVPHDWHSPQRPTHLMLVHPHSVQRNEDWGRAVSRG